MKKLKDLEYELSNVLPFENPKIDLEQVTFRILCGLDVLLY